MSIIRTKLAEDDIKEIYKYSFIHFGEQRAEKYYEGLENKFEAILEKSAHNTDYGFIKAGLKRSNYHSHAIYYRMNSRNELIIIRVLHQNMDEFRHLDE